MARITPTNEVWKDCPRADECCVNDCPLTLKRYTSDQSDPETKCRLGKTARLRLGEKWKLKNLGLFPRELASKKAWDSLPEKVKQERLAKLQKKSPITRLSEKGYAIVPKKRVISETHEQNGQKALEIATEGDVVGGMR